MEAEEAGKGMGSASLGALAGVATVATTRFLLRLDPSLKEREILPLNAVPAALAVLFALHIVDRCAKCRQILHRVHCERGCERFGSCLRREGTLWLRRRLDSDRGFRYKGFLLWPGFICTLSAISSAWCLVKPCSAPKSS